MIFDFQSMERIVKKDEVGNKFYNLYVLKNDLQLNVPDAFCITNPQIDTNEITKRIDPQKKYAVRSSSNNEDMTKQSAAGIFKSWLNIQGSEQVLKKIKQCFDSINSDEAQAYLKNKNSDLGKARISVIVQEMVEPQKAGVLFTINPVNNAHEIVVEYMDGVAEKLMDGSVLPQRAVFANIDGAKNTFLNDLVVTGQKIENFFQKPQDIEWAYQDNRFYLLQSRPITTSIDTSRDLSRVWTRANIGEILPKPLLPLSWDVFQKVLFGSYRFGFYALHDWILTNIIHLIPREFPRVISPQIFNNVAYLNLDTVRVAFSFEPWVSEEILNSGLGFNFNGGEVSKNLKLTTKLVKTFKTIIFHIERIFPFVSMERRLLNVLTKKLSRMEDTTFEDIVKRVSLIFGWHIAVTARSFSYLGFLSRKKAARNTRLTITELLIKQDKTDFVEELEKLQDIVNKTAGLKEKINENSINEFQNWQEFDDFVRQFGSFLINFGHRSNNEFELQQKSWSEDANQLRDALLRDNRKKDGVSAENSRQEYKVINSFKLREDLKNLLIAEYRTLKKHFLDMGRELVDARRLRNAQDIFFLKLSEITDIHTEDKKFTEKRNSEIIERKNQFLTVDDSNIPFSFTTDENDNIITSAIHTDDALKGVGCSNGIVKGRAVHVFSLEESDKLKEGDIMITSATDPGWTPLFAKVVGVITEIGGMLSHTATIAREFNIPMITGVQNLKTVIPDGKTIEMDGTSGTIEIMDEV